MRRSASWLVPDLAKLQPLRQMPICISLQDVLYAGLQPQQPLPDVPEDKYVALVSGLGLGDQGGETASVALLVDYLAGLLGGAKEHEQVAKVGRNAQKDMKI